MSAPVPLVIAWPLILIGIEQAPASRPAASDGPLKEIRRLLDPAALHRTDATYPDAMAARAEQLDRALRLLDEQIRSHPDRPERLWLHRARLDVLFERATLAGRPLDDLEAEAARLAAEHPSGPLAAVADYWRLRAELARLGPPTTTRPAGAVARVRLIAQFLEAHPDSDRRAALVAEIISAALDARDYVTAERWLEKLQREFPDDPTTTALAGRERLRRAVGDVWSPPLIDVRGDLIDWHAIRGRPAIVLFWASWDAASLALLERLRTWPALCDPARPALVTISLDTTCADAAAERERLALPSRLCCDGAGWSSPSAAHWGVRSLPLALVLDPEGRLNRVVEPGPDIETRLRTAWLDSGGTLD